MKRTTQTMDTIVVSDIHLGRIKKSDGLWKKYNEGKYAPDIPLLKLFQKCTQAHKDRLFEFVFNGDTFDFDNVHLPKMKLIEKFAKQVAWQRLNTSKETSIAKIRIILEEHKQLFQGLAEKLFEGHTLVFIRGNHDMELSWPEVKQEIRNTILKYTSHHQKNSEMKESQQQGSGSEVSKRIQFKDWFHYKKDTYYIEHGNQYDPYTVLQNNLYPFTFGNTIELSYGSFTARLIASRLGFFNPHVEDQFILSGLGYIRHYWKYHRPYKKELVTPWMVGSLQSMKALVKVPRYLLLSKRIEHEKRRNILAQELNIQPKTLARIEELWPSPIAQKKSELISLLRFDRFLIIFILTIAVLVLFFLENILLYPYYWQVIAGIAVLDIAAIVWVVFGKRYTGQRPYIQSANTIATLLHVPIIIFGHTHDVGRKKLEHKGVYMNTGTWAPAFYDVECTKPITGWRSFAWIHENQAKLFQWSEEKEQWSEQTNEPKRHTEQVGEYEKNK